MRKSILMLILWMFCANVFGQGTLKIHQGNRVASMQMSATDYDDWKSQDLYVDQTARKNLISSLYQTFNDEFDFIFLILNEDQIPSGISYYGMHVTVANAVTGIGKSVYDNSASYGSAGKLQGIMQLSKKGCVVGGPSLHELLHQWGNQAISTTYPSHWGFTGGSTKGQLGGFAQASLQTNVDGNPNKYKVDPFGENANGGNGIPYNELELYLMGLIPASEVSAFDVFNDVSNLDNSTYEFEAATRTTYDGAKLVAELGARVPSYQNSQKAFRSLFVVLTDTELTEAEWSYFDNNVKQFTNPGADTEGSYNFWEATGGRATLKANELANALKVQPSIVVTAPVGDPDFKFGQTVDVSWQTSLGGNLKIDLYSKGEFVQNISASIAAGTGAYQWVVPNNFPPGKDYRIKITSLANANDFDFADDAFSVSLQFYTINGYVQDDAGSRLAGATVKLGNELQLDQEQSVLNSWLAVSGGLITQSFIPTQNKLGKVQVHLMKAGTPTNDINVQLRNAVDEVLATATIPLAQISTDRAWVSAGFMPPVDVVVGETYKIALSTGYDTNTDYVVWWGSNNAPYDNGESSRSGWDMCFKTFYGDGAEVLTDANGEYQFTQVKGWSGQLAARLADRSADPITIDPLMDNLAGQNLTILGPYTISGSVLDLGGAAMPNATVRLGAPHMLDQEATTGSSYFTMGSFSSEQSFVPAQDFLGSVQLKLKKMDGLSGTITVAVKDADGNVLGSDVLSVDSVKTSFDWCTVQFKPSLPTKAGQEYAISLSIKDASDNLYWLSNSNDIYPNGKVNYSSYPDTDFMFRTFSGDGATALTNASGMYSFTVPAQWTGMLNVVNSDATLSFAEISISQILENKTAQNFQAVPYNDVPQITAQVNLATNEDAPLQLSLGNLSVTDGNDSYPTGFSLIVSEGDNYTVSGTTITPKANFSGQLTVPVQVNDGKANSTAYDLTVTVQPVNDAPLITAQASIQINEDLPYQIELSQLTVTDVDSDTSSFVLTIQSGDNYTVSGTTITPATDFVGTLSVPVVVSDGQADSQSFALSITVVRNEITGVANNQPDDQAIKVYSRNGWLVVSAGKPLNGKLSLMDMLGRVSLVQEVSGLTELELPLSLRTGKYIVVLNLDNGPITRAVWVD